MKRRSLSAAAAALLLGGLISPHSAFAAENTIMLFPIYTPVQYTNSICVVNVAANTEFSMTLYQHSEEREALVMYQTADITVDDTGYCCVQMEPGDYTLEISVPAIIGCPTMLTRTLAFTVADPDYAVDYQTTAVTVDLYAGIDHTAEPGSTQSDVTSYVENGTQYISTAFAFNCAEGLRGDVNQDGQITSLDAIAALQDYTAGLSQLPSPISAVQKVCADIDGDGIIQPADAIGILQYYTAGLTENQPLWEDIIGRVSY